MSGSLDRIAGVQEAQGDLAGALQQYQAALAINRKLAAYDPYNATRQFNVSLGLNRVGEVQRSQHDYPAALRSFQEALAIRRKLATQDPSNAKWQHDLAYVERDLALALLLQGQKPAARAGLERFGQIVERQAAAQPEDYILQIDRAVARWKCAGLLDLSKPADHQEAIRLLHEAMDILGAVQQGPGLQPKHARWLREIGTQLKGLES